MNTDEFRNMCVKTAKPVIFNRELSEKIREGNKTQTRRVIKPQPEFKNNETGIPEIFDDHQTFEFKIDGYKNIYDYPVKAKYAIGDILYLQEAWKVERTWPSAYGFNVRFRDGKSSIYPCLFETFERYVKFSKYEDKSGWQSPYFMPREVARTFVRITNIKVERLRDITSEDCIKEGVNIEDLSAFGPITRETYTHAFADLWNKTLSANTYSSCSWDANPWVFVYEFKLIKPENK